MKFILSTVLVFLCTVSLSAKAVLPPIEFERIVVEIADTDYELEYAKTLSQRARGLMFRQRMCSDCGMLFNFDVPRIGSIWMKNTQIPLDLAYVDDNGIITDIFPLTPHDLTPVRSSKPISYAIEMNQGWFAKQGVKVGDRIKVKRKNISDRN